MSVPLHVLDSGPTQPSLNMALDEALLITATRRAAPLLRFYGWLTPAATFGYFQRYEEIARSTGLRPLLRRPTAGGLVPHDADWTYSLSVPPEHPWQQLSALESYRTMHEWICAAFHQLGIRPELANEPRREIPGQCFVGHERFDVLWNGRKIAGAAQRRNRLGLLIQGSVQPPPGIARRDWQEAMQTTFPSIHFQGIETVTLDDHPQQVAEELMKSRYGRDEFHRSR